MAYVYSTAQSTSSYGNVKMKVNIYRGDVTRTEKAVSFKFGVCFTPDIPTTDWTHNSIAAHYWAGDGYDASTKKYTNTTRFANVTTGETSNSRVYGGDTIYAHYTNRNTAGKWDKEHLCFGFYISELTKDTTSVQITIGVGWADWAGTQKGSMTFSLSIPKYIGPGTAPTITSITAGHQAKSFTIKGKQGKSGVNNPIAGMAIYYTHNGSTPTFSDAGACSLPTHKVTLTPNSGNDYNITINNSSTSENGCALPTKDYTVKAVARSYFSGTGSALTASMTSGTLDYWTDGGTPSVVSIQPVDDLGQKFTVTYKNGANGIDNALAHSALYYTVTPSSSSSIPNPIRNSDSTPGANTSKEYPLLTTSASQTSNQTTRELSGKTENYTVKAFMANAFAKAGSAVTIGSTITKSITYRTEGEAGSIQIIDNGNNTVTIKGNKGTNGINNGITSSTVYYKINGASNWTPVSLTATSGGSFTIGTDKYPLKLTKNCTVAAYIESTFTYAGKNVSKTKTATATSVNAIYYPSATEPSPPVLSYTKSRLTIKENWIFSWNPPSGVTPSGYRICLTRNNKSVIDYNRETSQTGVTIDPVSYDFKPGDTVRMTIQAYTKDANGNKLYSDTVSSEVHTVMNAGIVRIKADNKWTEGQVWVKANDKWVEADTVFVKTASGWKEST